MSGQNNSNQESRRESLPAGRQACPPLAGNLYQKFRKLPCLPEVDILSIPACRQAGNYGTNDFGNLGNFPVRLSPLMDILSIPA